MKKYIQERKGTSAKTHQQDPARNDNFTEEKNTPAAKERKRKVPHGRYIGKKWSPQG